MKNELQNSLHNIVNLNPKNFKYLINHIKIENIIYKNLLEIQQLENSDEKKLIILFVLKENEIRNEFFDLFINELKIYFMNQSLINFEYNNQNIIKNTINKNT